ncbi:MAG: hypothetical protein BZ137_09580 [Methanosphaera sp. rholeuAM130]|nr:MAG: hypothetical protein BZ137_09580 [Methanosphaera sp. rholeuAM130]
MMYDNQYISLSGGYSYNVPSAYLSVRNMITTIKKKIDSLLNKLSEGISSYLMDNLKINLRLFKDVLMELTGHSRELFDFMSIERMYLYVMENKRYDFIGRLNQLFDLYCSVVCRKLRSDEKEYHDNYENFEDALMDTEEYFYLNICKKSEYFDVRVLSSITNSLLKK